MQNKKVKILVTGASGFIGNHVVNYLCNSSNHKIYVLTRDIGNIENKVWSSKVTKIEGDISENKKNWYDFLDKPDKLIHLAWDGLPNYNEPFHITKNLVIDFKFLSSLIRSGLSDITITGTCFEYGMLEGEVNENMPTNPKNFYALAKDALRKMLEILKSSNTFDLKWVRLFYMYGAGQNPNSILPQLEKAIINSDRVFNMSGGEQMRDYLHVEEVAKNIVAISLQSKILGIINNCSGSPISVLDLVNNYLEKSEKRMDLNIGYYPYSNTESMALWGNNHKLKQILLNYLI